LALTLIQIQIHTVFKSRFLILIELQIRTIKSDSQHCLKLYTYCTGYIQYVLGFYHPEPLISVICYIPHIVVDVDLSSFRNIAIDINSIQRRNLYSTSPDLN
jgi:hypothetical protein